MASDEAHGLVGGGFDADAVGGDAEGLGYVLFHGGGVREDFGGFGDEGGVDVAELTAHFADEGGGFFEDFERADVFAAGVAGREVVADVGKAGSAKDGVGNGVTEHVGIGVTLQAMGVGDFDPAQDELAVFGKLVDVVSGADKWNPVGCVHIVSEWE